MDSISGARVHEVRRVVIRKPSTPFLDPGIGKLARFRMRIRERALQKLSATALQLALDRLENESTPVPLLPVDVLNELRRKGDRHTLASHRV
jgi:hypothetical protein